ncbi:hypothetical protein [Pyxidicoccus sp. MSG2]|uniref:hypothetical protein n=1 Tax=Pyxidicoccus sp. MSG2 TaxID=2996790 RepID=UPI0022708973|nr:hypothetical protein [Pyxidicoccus sp. MSG2]MCY1019147.1 hypothetical protein [Pyxidicoccus sp. MSG2]
MPFHSSMTDTTATALRRLDATRLDAPFRGLLALDAAVALGDGIAITRSEVPVTRFFDLETGEALGEVAGTTAPEDALRLALWDALSDGPVAFHRRRELAPLVHFPDAMEEVVVLRDGLVVARGQTEKDPLYVLMLHT